MRVSALYRFPVKGFTPESCESLSVSADSRIAGDRVLGFRFANATVSGDAWGRKAEFVVLSNTPGLARLHLSFDHDRLRLRIALEGGLLADEALDTGGRQRLVAALEEYVLGLEVNPLSSDPGRLPVRLIGDGRTSRYQDDQSGLITLHSRESLAVVAAASGAPDLSEHRFRSNIAIEGLAAWEEQGWIGRAVRIGTMDFDVVKPKARCLATHANPVTGAQDLALMSILSKTFPADKPTFAVSLALRSGGGSGKLHVGDTVTLLD